MPPKRKRSSVATATPTADDGAAPDRSKLRRSEVPLPPNAVKPPRRQSTRGGAGPTTDPNLNPDIMDGVNALRASPDGHEDGGLQSRLKPSGVNGAANGVSAESTHATTDINSLPTNGHAPVVNGIVPTPAASKNKRKRAGAPHVKAEEVESNIGGIIGSKANVTGPAENAGMAGDPEAGEGLDEDMEDEGEVKEALSRPPPVNSEYLPLPWKGRLGYVRDLHTPTSPRLTHLHDRLVSTRTCGVRILPSSAPERAASRASLSIAIP